MSKKFQVTNCEIVDHGIDNPSYFQGCGTAFTDYENCVTGAGDTPAEAFNDILEQVAQFGPRIEGVPPQNEDGTLNFAAYGSIELGDLEQQILGDLDLKEMPEKPSAYQNDLRNNGVPDDFDEDEEEPDREDFEDDEEYEEALAEYKQEHEAYAELQDCPESSMYYMSLRFNCKPID